MKSSARHQTALSAFSIIDARVSGKAQRLQTLIKQHRQKAAAYPLDWGYVGSLGYVEQQLDDILAFLSGDVDDEQMADEKAGRRVR